MSYLHSPTTDHPSSTRMSLAPYSGPWGKSEVLHLLRRTTFGNKRSDMEALVAMDLDAAIEQLFTPEATPLPPVNEYEGIKVDGIPSLIRDSEVAPGETWVNTRRSEDGTLQWLRMRGLKNWMGRLIQEQGLSIHQKMIFFLQSFVTNNYGDSGHAQSCYQHYQLFFQYAFGNYKEFIKAYTVLPLTLQYLNGNVNVLGAPDENYARELQELFTIGKGPNSGYTEQDVREAARVLTGWTFFWPEIETQFVVGNHDPGNKQFSAFYNNTQISGRSGQAGREELDDLLDMIFSNPECAMYLSRRIYTFFVFPEISEEVEAEIIPQMAEMMRENNYDFIPVLKTLLRSEHFFDPANRGVIIKSPLDFIYGSFRTFDVEFPNNYSSLLEKYLTETGPMWLTSEMGVNLGDAPSVAGWPAYYQTPTYDKNWATANTIALRALRTDSLIYWGFWTPGRLLNIDVLSFTASFERADDPNHLIEDLLEFLLGHNDPDPSLVQNLKGILLSGQADDSYWTVAWVNYVSDPGSATFTNTVENRLKSLYQRILQLPEFHLH